MIASARRLGSVLLRAAVRLDDSLLGDAIGCVFLSVILFILAVFAGILS